MRHAKTYRRLALTILVAVMGIAGPAAALTRRVPSEYATINAALDASTFGDTVLVAPGVYSDVDTRDIGLGVPFTACVFLKDGVVLRSEAGPGLTTIDMMQASGLQPVVVLAFFLPSDETAAEGFTIKGETALHGVATAFGGRVTFRDCIFFGLDAGPSTGGGIAANTDLRLIDCEFVNCMANAGGAMIHSGGHLQMIDTVVRECSNKGLYLLGVPDATMESAWIENCTFLNNYSAGNAGAVQVFAYDGGATFTGCHFEGNTGESAAGAIGWGGAGAKTIENCTFINNGVVGPYAEGGAINIGSAGPCVIRGNTFYGNYQVDGSFGGAVLKFVTPATLENNIIAFASGGTAITTSGGLTTSCNVFWNNTDGNGIPLSETDREVDPLFCNPQGGDFTVQSSSPCVEPNSEGCGQIGALPIGCGTVGVESVSWGRVKDYYREGRER